MIQKIFDWLPKTMLGTWIYRFISYMEFKLISLYHGDELMKLMREIIWEDKPLLIKPSEVFLIYAFSKNQSHLDGDYAEVGVFKGATAKAICEAKGDKDLYLFDTFEGLPGKDSIDLKFKAGMYKSNFEIVKQKLQQYDNVHIYKGYFPSSGKPIKNNRFAFVHLDVDIYQSTKESIEFFYPRMVDGGIIISHDYHAQGVKKAFNEFFQDKPEEIVELPMSQCMITKRA